MERDVIVRLVECRQVAIATNKCHSFLHPRHDSSHVNPTEKDVTFFFVFRFFPFFRVLVGFGCLPTMMKQKEKTQHYRNVTYVLVLYY